jgi:hypothetical protein
VDYKDFEVHEAMKLKLLQQANDEWLASGLSDSSMDELLAEAERDAAADDPAGRACACERYPPTASLAREDLQPPGPRSFVPCQPCDFLPATTLWRAERAHPARPV